MKKSGGKIDWKIEEDDGWQTTAPPASLRLPAPSNPADPSTQRKELALAAVVALLLLLLGGWLWQRPSTPKGALNAARTTPLQAQQTLTTTLELADSSLRVESIQRNSDRLMAQVIVNYPEDGAMRETRFFVRKGDSWQRMAPDPTLTGPAKTLTIAHFTILYQAVDAGAVYEAAPKLEQLYATLRHDFGLPLVAASNDYTIEVTTDRVQPLTNFNSLQHRLTVSSPILLSAPVTMPATLLLYQEMVYPLAHLLLVESLHQHDELWRSYLTDWSSIVSAIPLWELWDNGGPLASEHSQVVRWVYENSKSEKARQLLPDNYESLCRIYRIWQVTPVDMPVPITCTDADQQLLLTWKYPAPSTWLLQLRASDETIDHVKGFSTPVIGETMIEYIVATYGRDTLPRLIAALGEYTSLDTFIPALLGVSVADFEAGWQAYLARHY